jgi:hypothetical protein
MRYEAEVVGWSKDGTAVLLGIQGDGPEGGSNYEFRLVESNGTITRAETSDTLSAGAGAVPNRISHSQCVTNLKQLKTRLDALGFSGLSLDESNCRFESKTPASSGPSLTVSFGSGQLRVMNGTQTVVSLPSNFEDSSAMATSSPNGRAVVVTGEFGVVAYFVSANENFKELRLVKLAPQ